MVLLWFTKIKLKMSTIEDVPSWHKVRVMEMLTENGLDGYGKQTNAAGK